MPSSTTPVVTKNEVVEVGWPMVDGTFQNFICTILNIIKCKYIRKGSQFKYELLFNDGDIRRTRLLNLSWSRCKTQNASWDNNIPCDSSSIIANGALNPSCRYILAPMVGASELAFRLLCRKYGAGLAYTPMMSSILFATDSKYRETEFQTVPSDRPLVAHFSGNDPQVMLQAAKYVETKCDAIDLNLGCPQRVAYAGHFGSYLLDNEDRQLIINIITTLSTNLSIPVFVKIRLLDTIDETIQLCQQLAAAGAALIAVHARYRVNLVGRAGPGARDGAALLDQIAAIKRAVPTVPIIANGNVRCWEDVHANLESTGADGIMSAEGLLDDPALFAPALAKTASITAAADTTADVSGGACVPTDKLQLASEYLDLVAHHPVKLKSVIFHIRRMCREELTQYQLLNDCIVASSVDAVRSIVDTAIAYKKNNNFVYDPMKEKRAKEASERKAYEEGKRKRFEERMVRKAKREKKDAQFYLNQGTDTPTVEELEALRAMSQEDAFVQWRARHSQHCFAFHFAEGGCARDRACSFLHMDANVAEPLAYG